MNNALYDIVKLTGGGGSTGNGNGNVVLMPFSYESIGQGTWGIVADAGQFTENLFYNSSNADGDNISYKAELSAGTYTLDLFGKTHTAYAIVDISIDGTVAATFDLYGVNTDNVRQRETDIVVASSGVKEIKVTVNGKNPSASNYFAAFTYLALNKQ